MPAPADIVIRDPKPGDLGWVIHRQAVLYAAEHGWDWTFEALVARIVADYVRDYREDVCWCGIAERDGRILGSAFVMREDDGTAKLRLVYVEAEARGTGLGRRLVEAAIGFARQAGYARLVLWTNANLEAADGLYRSLGFELVGEEPHRSFGHDLIGREFALELAAVEGS